MERKKAAEERRRLEEETIKVGSLSPSCPFTNYASRWVHERPQGGDEGRVVQRKSTDNFFWALRFTILSLLHIKEICLEIFTVSTLYPVLQLSRMVCPNLPQRFHT